MEKMKRRYYRGMKDAKWGHQNGGSGEIHCSFTVLCDSDSLCSQWFSVHESCTNQEILSYTFNLSIFLLDLTLSCSCPSYAISLSHTQKTWPATCHMLHDMLKQTHTQRRTQMQINTDTRGTTVSDGRMKTPSSRGWWICSSSSLWASNKETLSGVRALWHWLLASVTTRRQSGVCAGPSSPPPC